MSGRGFPWNCSRAALILARLFFIWLGLDQRGRVVVRKRWSRSHLLHFTSNLRVQLVGMEARGGAHFLGRALQQQGHQVQLMPAQDVKPFAKTNRNDYIDAEAIAKAVTSLACQWRCRPHPPWQLH